MGMRSLQLIICSYCGGDHWRPDCPKIAEDMGAKKSKRQREEKVRMKNNSRVEVVIAMENVDHASKLRYALEKFLINSDMGGDCYLSFESDEAGDKAQWYIGHDVRKCNVELRISPVGEKTQDKPFVFGCDMDKADLLVENNYLREQIQRFTNTDLPPLTESETETLRAIFKPKN